MLSEARLKQFWAKVEKTDNCWIWNGCRVAGYGQFSVNGKGKRSHRIAYELLVGPIPVGLHLDHLCRNPSCVNPAHLEPVTSRENTLRGNAMFAGDHNRRKTHCPYGHEYTPENTYRSKKGRECRTCGRMWVRRYAERKRLKLEAQDTPHAN